VCRRRRRRADFELQRRNLRLQSIFNSPFAVCTDEFEVVFFGLFLREAQALTMLPNIALLTSDAMRPVVLKMLEGVGVL
jgi:hypothetical protein